MHIFNPLNSVEKFVWSAREDRTTKNNTITRTCFRVAVLLAVWIENTTFVQSDGLNVEKLHPVAEIVVIIFYDTSASSGFFLYLV